MTSAWRVWFSRGAALDDARWVVLDVESSGLDAARDRLLAIAALGVHFNGSRAWIELGDSFEVVLRQPGAAAVPDKDNILLHGIGVGAQRGGVDPRDALRAFVAFVGASPLVAFHAPFDRRLIRRAFDDHHEPPPPNPWLDLEPLAAVLYPKVRARALDEWMTYFGIRCAVRHQAAADTLATAELLLHLWPEVRAQLRRSDFRAVAALAAQRRWLQSP